MADNPGTPDKTNVIRDDSPKGLLVCMIDVLQLVNVDWIKGLFVFVIGHPVGTVGQNNYNTR